MILTLAQGDAVGIARETSRQLGLGTNVYNAERLGLGGGGDMPGSEVYDFVEAADGFAEVFPQHASLPTNLSYTSFSQNANNSAEI